VVHPLSDHTEKETSSRSISREVAETLLVTAWSKPDLIVYDPFIRIGTTALACLSLDVKFVGTEMDKHYIKIAKENLISRERAIKQEKRKRKNTH
jgi:DNA modification methylase